MYKCIIKGQEVNIETEQALEEMLANGVLAGNEKATNVENGKEGLIKQSKWFQDIITRNPNIVKPSMTSKVIGIICVVLGGILVLISAILKTRSGDIAAALVGRITGTVIGAVLFPGIVFGVVYAVKKKKPGIMLFGILFLVFSIFGFSGSVESVMRSSDQFDNFNEKLVEMQQNAANMEAWEPYSFDKSTYGEYSEIGEITQDYLMAYTKLNNELVSNMQTISADKALSVSVLGSHSKIQSEIAKIEQFEGQFGVYKQDIEVLEADYLKKLDELAEWSNTAKGFKEGYLEGSETNHTKTAEIFEKTSQMIEVTKEILKFLEAREGLYEVENDQVLFSQDSDVKLYNDLIQKLNQVAEELTKLDSETTSTTGQ